MNTLTDEDPDDPIRTEVILETIQLPMPMDEFRKNLRRMVKEHGANAYVRGNGKSMDVITRGKIVS